MLPARRLVGVLLGIAVCGPLALPSGPPVFGGDDKKVPPVAKAGEKRIAFHMEATPWKKTFEWLASTTGLPVVANQVPTGSFSFISPRGRTYTIPEVIDIVNEALMASKCILIRRPTVLLLLPADERPDPALIPLIRVEELSKRGKTELVHLVLPLTTLDVKDALDSVKKLLGPFGQASAIDNRLLLRDTAGNLERVIRLIQEVELAGAPDTTSLSYTCSRINASDAQRILTELLGRPGPKERTRLTIAIDDRTNTIHIRGPADRIAQAKEILARIDVAPKGKPPAIADAPILKTYTVPAGQSEPLAKTLQQLYRDSTQVRITAAGADRILVYGTPDDQFAIARHIQEALQAVTLEVIPLTALEVRRTAELLRTMFSTAEKLFIEADISRNAIIIRGTRDQVDEVRTALRALGETGTPSGGFRVITLEQGDAATLAEELQKVFTKMRSNPLRVILPGGKSEPEAKPVPPGKEGAGGKKEGVKAAPPLTIVASGNRLLIACDDPQALALMQQLARLYSEPQQGGLEIVRLQHGSATDVAKALDEAFNGKPGSGTTGRRAERVRIVPEPITNVLLVKASPLDLLTIRRLLSRSLDVPGDREASVRTYFLGPLRYASAAEIAKVLRDLYRDGGSSVVSITVDTRTNSVIMRCSAPVFEDARKLMEMLDVKVEKKE